MALPILAWDKYLKDTIYHVAAGVDKVLKMEL